MQLLSSRYVQIGLALFIAALLIAGFSTTAAAAGPVYHTVQPGQTLYSIASNYGTSVWAISCANGIYNPNYIYAGQVLVIPQGGWYGGGCKPGYKPGNDCGCQQSYNYPKQDGCGPCDGGYQPPHDGYKPPYQNPCGCDGGYQPPHQDGCGPCDGGYQPPQYGCGCDGGQPAKWYPQPGPKFGCYYTVKWGDGLFRIALKYGVSWVVLAQANQLSNGNYIFAGQVLRVPCVY
jgi:LysM repeat protein